MSFFSDVYLCVKEPKQHDFKCSKFKTFEDADMFFQKILAERSDWGRSVQSRMVTVCKFVPAKPVLTYKLSPSVDITDRPSMFFT